MTKTGWIVASAVMVSLAIGCGKGGDSSKAGKGGKVTPSAVKAQSPKEAVLNFAKAFETADKGLLLASVEASPKEQPVIEAMFDMATAMAKFNEKMTKAYGEEAMAKSGAKVGSKIPKQAEIEKKLKITETGDKAVANLEGEKDPMQLVKVDGAWKVDATAMLAQDKGAGDLDQMVKMSAAMIKAVDDVSENIGKPGTTAQSVNEEFGKRMMAAMMEMMPKKGGPAMPVEAPESGQTPKAPEGEMPKAPEDGTK